MWLRNSVFHSLGMRHYDEKLAKEMIHSMFDLQQPDGLIPHRRFTLYIPLLHSAAGSFAGNENTQRNGSRSVSMICPNPGIFRLKANNFQYQLKTTLCPGETNCRCRDRAFLLPLSNLSGIKRKNIVFLLEKKCFAGYIVKSSCRMMFRHKFFLFFNTSGENNMTANTDDTVPRWCEAGSGRYCFHPLCVK